MAPTLPTTPIPASHIANDSKAIETVTERAQKLMLYALDNGLYGPPYSPFDLAELLGIDIRPSLAVKDACIKYSESGQKHIIEYNPNQSEDRINFSIAHEIAHTLFEGSTSTTYNRETRQEVSGKILHLEMLCNIGAAEILMPTGSFHNLKDEELSLSKILSLRKKYKVSTESILIRIAKLTKQPCSIFCASKVKDEDDASQFKINYCIWSKGSTARLKHNTPIDSPSVISECSAIGFTSEGTELWPGFSEEHLVQCVGLPPYPGNLSPRVAGLITPTRPVNVQDENGIKYLLGDASQPRGAGINIIAHITNDKAIRWGGAGFAKFIANKWPSAHKDFTLWAKQTPQPERLGKAHVFQLDESIYLYSMVAQKGYGYSPLPRIRYSALRQCLAGLSELATEQSARIHMPRIGCGHAGGDWELISELIQTSLSQKGHSVTVYDLPK